MAVPGLQELRSGYKPGQVPMGFCPAAECRWGSLWPDLREGVDGAQGVTGWAGPFRGA